MTSTGVGTMGLTGAGGAGVTVGVTLGGSAGRPGSMSVAVQLGLHPGEYSADDGVTLTVFTKSPVVSAGTVLVTV